MKEQKGTITAADGKSYLQNCDLQDKTSQPQSTEECRPLPKRKHAVVNQRSNATTSATTIENPPLEPRCLTLNRRG